MVGWGTDVEYRGEWGILTCFEHFKKPLAAASVAWSERGRGLIILLNPL